MRILLPALFILAIPILGTSFQDPKSQPIDDFLLVESVDPITDERTRFIVTSDQYPADSGWPAGISWACTNDSTYRIGFKAEGRLTLFREITEVIWRFDKNEPEGPTMWHRSMDEGLLFVPRALQAAFTESAKESEQLVIRYTDHLGETHTHTFSMKGFTRAFGLLACGGIAAGRLAP